MVLTPPPIYTHIHTNHGFFLCQLFFGAFFLSKITLNNNLILTSSYFHDNGQFLYYVSAKHIRETFPQQIAVDKRVMLTYYEKRYFMFTTGESKMVIHPWLTEI